MATVHLARKFGDERLVAVKTMRPDLADDEEAATTLFDEARVLSRIRHPSVVAVLEVVRAGRDVLLVMPFVRGVTIAELLVATSRADRDVPAPIASAIAQDVLAGLGAAHEARGERGELLGVVHRDVSPQNIIVGIDGVAQVLDFGIAKAAGRGAQTTRDGALKGKLAYMAPEQLHGAEVSARTDLYAVGVILWEMLALRRLFAGENEADTLRRVLVGEVPSLSELRPELPPAIDAFFTRALSRHEGARFATGREMGAALHALVPRATQAEVAAAIEARCATELAKRPGGAAPQASPAHATPSASRTASSLASPATSSPPAAPLPAAEVQGSRRRAPKLLAGALVLGALVAAGAVAWRGRAASVGAGLAAVSATPESPASAGVEAIPAAPAPTPTATEVPPLATPSATPSATAPSLRANGGSTRKPAALPANCAVPYTVDEHGRKKYRIECLP